MKTKLDKTYMGIIVGIILPIIAFFGFYWFKAADQYLLGNYVDYLMADKLNRNGPLIFTMVPNLVLFYFTNFQFKWYQFTVGLVGITLLFTIPIVISLI